jgi:hypothetical protein
MGLEINGTTSQQTPPMEMQDIGCVTVMSYLFIQVLYAKIESIYD